MTTLSHKAPLHCWVMLAHPKVDKATDTLISREQLPPSPCEELPLAGLERETLTA